MSIRSPVAILYDHNGNVLLGPKVSAESLPVTFATDQVALPVTVGVAASSGSITEFLTDDGLIGGGHALNVDGGAPVPFWFPADGTKDIVVTGLRLVFSAQAIDFDGASFGKGSALTVGIAVSIIADDGAFTKTLATIKLNEDFFRLLQFDISQAGTTDAMAATLPFQGRVLLKAGSSDEVRVVVGDDLTAGVLGINYLTATIYGVKDI